MRPTTAIVDITNGSLRYAFAPCYLALRKLALLEKLQDFLDIGACEFRPRRFLATQYGRFQVHCGKVHTSLFNSVLNVIGLSTKEKVIGIHAWRYIAAMKNLKPIGDWPDVNRPRKTMGEPALAVMQANLPVPKIHGRTREYPATIGLFNDMAHENFFRQASAILSVALNRAKEALSTIVCGGFDSKFASAIMTLKPVSRNGSIGFACRRMLNTCPTQDYVFEVKVFGCHEKSPLVSLADYTSRHNRRQNL